MAWYDGIVDAYEKTPGGMAEKKLRGALGASSQPQPGVGGPIADKDAAGVESILHQDPITGLYFDSRTGTAYNDARGQVPVTNPNVAQQVAANFARSQSFLGALPGMEEQRQQVFAGQTKLAGNLEGFLAGHGNSLAAGQLGVGMQSIADQQQGMAAGVSGAASPLAGLMAARNTGSAQVATNNASAMARAKEEEDARNALISLFASQGAGVESAAGRTTGASLDFSRLGLQGQLAQQGLNQKAKENETETGLEVAKGIGMAAG